MQDKEMIKISEALWFQEGPGVRNTQYTDSGVKLLNVANLVDGKVDLSTSDRYISEEEAYGKYKHFLCDEGDFIIASSGIKVEYIDKKMGFITKDMLPLCMNTSTIRFKAIDKDKLNIKYFMHYLKSFHFKQQLAKQITGSAQLNYGPSHLNRMVMPMIDISEQNMIVNNLTKIEQLIDNQNSKLALLDELIKARFVEMFSTEKHKEKLINLCKFINGDRGKNYPSGNDIVDWGVPFINAGHLEGNKIDFSDMNYITEKKFEELNSGKIQENDILYCLRGSLGKKALVEIEKGAIASSLVILRSMGEIEPIFLLYSLEQPYILEQMKKANNGSSQPNLSAQSVKDYEVILPLREKQIEFVEFVRQLDKSKFVIQQQIGETQKLFDKLMQEYFG